jgi:hypothetical protein
VHRSKRRLLFGELLVEVTCVRIAVLKHNSEVGYDKLVGMCTNDGWEVRDRDPFVEDIIPVDVLEEWLLLNLFGVGLTGPKAPGGVACEQLDFIVRDLYVNR